MSAKKQHTTKSKKSKSTKSVKKPPQTPSADAVNKPFVTDSEGNKYYFGDAITSVRKNPAPLRHGAPAKDICYACKHPRKNHTRGKGFCTFGNALALSDPICYCGQFVEHPDEEKLKRKVAQRLVPCRTCEGTGHIGMGVCINCEGHGRVLESVKDINAPYASDVCACGHTWDEHNHSKDRIVHNFCNYEDCSCSEFSHFGDEPEEVRPPDTPFRTTVRGIPVELCAMSICFCGHSFSGHSHKHGVCLDDQCDCSAFRSAITQQEAEEAFKHIMGKHDAVITEQSAASKAFTEADLEQVADTFVKMHKIAHASDAEVKQQYEATRMGNARQDFVHRASAGTEFSDMFFDQSESFGDVVDDFVKKAQNGTCVRCGAPYLPTGQCSRWHIGCQGGRGETPIPTPRPRSYSDSEITVSLADAVVAIVRVLMQRRDLSSPEVQQDFAYMRRDPEVQSILRYILGDK